MTELLLTATLILTVSLIREIKHRSFYENNYESVLKALEEHDRGLAEYLRNRREK